MKKNLSNRNGNSVAKISQLFKCVVITGETEIIGLDGKL